MTAKQETKLQTKHGFTPIPGVSARALRTLASSPGAVCACHSQRETSRVYTISWCNNSNNNSAKRPRMRVNKGELNGQNSPTQMIWKRLPGQHPYNASLFGITLFGASLFRITLIHGVSMGPYKFIRGYQIGTPFPTSKGQHKLKEFHGTVNLGFGPHHLSFEVRPCWIRLSWPNQTWRIFLEIWSSVS